MSRSRAVTKILEGYPDDVSKDVLEGIAEEIWVHAYFSWGGGDQPGADQDM